MIPKRVGLRLISNNCSERSLNMNSNSTSYSRPDSSQTASLHCSDCEQRNSHSVIEKIDSFIDDLLKAISSDMQKHEWQ